MARLPNNDRATATAEFNNRVGLKGLGEIVGLTKTDVRAALNGLDDHIDDNAVAINQSIPQPARATLTTPQKAWLLSLVLERRYRRA